jgi:hypothetical protein
MGYKGVGGSGGGWDGAAAAAVAEGSRSGEGTKGEAKGTTGVGPWNAVRGSVPPLGTRLVDDWGECVDAGESGECDWGEGRSTEGNGCRERGSSEVSCWLAARGATREDAVAAAAAAAGPARAAAEEGAEATGRGAGRGAGPSHIGSFHSDRCWRRLVRGCVAAAMEAAGEPLSLGRDGEATIGIIVLMGAPRKAVATARVAGA